MPLSFPLGFGAFQDKLRIMGSPPLQLARFEEMSGTGHGQVIVSQIAPPAWSASWTMADTPEEEAAEIDGLIGVIGSTGRVLLCDPTRHFPRRDPDGTGIGGADVVVSALGGNGRSIRLSGLPAGYALTAGDMVGATYGSSRRALFRMAESATASSAGVTPFFDVSPHLPVGLAAGAPANLRRPTSRFVLTSWEPGRSDGVARRGMSLGAIEVTQ